MSVEVIVPFAGDCPHRRRAWEFLKRQYRWPVAEAGLEGGPWVKARAVMPQIAASSAEIVVVADADCWTDGLGAAVAAVEWGWPWAIPHDLVFRLSEGSTRGLIRGEPWEGLGLDEEPYRGVSGGGFIVARRETLLEVPLDPRFEGWGQEDSAWGQALRGLLGPGWRGAASLLHLWHPPQERLERSIGSMEGWRLRRRYSKARHDPAALRELVDEARRELDPTFEEARCEGS